MQGEILVRGEKVDIQTPNDAIARGIGMVHQHFMLVPVMTVTENVMLGIEPTQNGIFLDKAKVAQRIREISEQYGLEVDPDAYVKDLSVGIQQRVEIIKVLYREADILILDEPTAVLTPQEVEGLFKILQTLIEKGKSIIFITHKLKEVMEVADRITVLRGGRTVGTVSPKKVNPEKLAAMMVGREVNLVVRKKPCQAKEIALEVQDLFVRDERGNMTVNGVSFDVRKGEVLGIAGVQGNGQTELVYALTGLAPHRGRGDPLAGQDDPQADAAPRHRAGYGACARGPPATRTGAVLPDLRQSGPVQLLSAPVCQGDPAPAEDHHRERRKHWSSSSTSARLASTCPPPVSPEATSKR